MWRPWRTQLNRLHNELTQTPEAPDLDRHRLWVLLGSVAVLLVVLHELGSPYAQDVKLTASGYANVRERIPLAFAHALLWHAGLLLVLPALIARVCGLRDLGQRFRGGSRAVGAVLLGALLLVPLAWWLHDNLAWHPRESLLRHTAWTYSKIGLYGLALLGYAVILEAFFRGYVLFGLRAEIGNLALPVSAFIYVFAWLDAPWPQTLWALGEGAVLGGLALRWGSWWPGALLVALGMMIRDGVIFWAAIG